MRTTMSARALATRLRRTFDKEPVVVVATVLAVTSTAAVALFPVHAYDEAQKPLPRPTDSIFIKSAPGENPTRRAAA